MPPRTSCETFMSTPLCKPKCFQSLQNPLRSSSLSPCQLSDVIFLHSLLFFRLYLAYWQGLHITQLQRALATLFSPLCWSCTPLSCVMLYNSEKLHPSLCGRSQRESVASGLSHLLILLPVMHLANTGTQKYYWINERMWGFQQGSWIYTRNIHIYAYANYPYNICMCLL